MTSEVETSSGNVFEDLGFRNPEEHKAKVFLALAIKDHIREHGWSPEDAAHSLGLDQADVERLMRGVVSGFTFDRLIRCLSVLDRKVEFVVEGFHPTGKRAASRKPLIPA